MNNQQFVRRHGFTVVEILTVLAVTAVLSAIILAAFRGVREKGRQTTCADNLKQITLAMQQYVQDSDGKYPFMGISSQENTQFQGWFWVYRARDYLKNPLLQQCPSYGGERAGSGGKGINAVTDYSYNYWRLSQRGTLWRDPDGTLHRNGQHEAVLLNPATTWLNTDMDADMISQTDSPSSRLPYTSSCGRTFAWETRHSGGANYSFIDGHVKWFRPEQMSEVECSNGPLPARSF